MKAVMPSAMETVQMWAGFNGCRQPVWNPEPTLDLFPDVPGPATTVLRYADCPPGGEVALWTVHGGEHAVEVSAEFGPCILGWLLAHPKP